MQSEVFKQDNILMISKKNMILLAVLLAAFFIGYIYYQSNADYSRLPKVEASTSEPLKQLPDFSQYTDVKAKKDAFFSLLYPILADENRHILTIRQAIIELNSLDELNEQHLRWLNEVATFYKLDSELSRDQLFETLLRRVDIVPISLALTQAAIESGWGSSRFAKKGNNLFGQWCFSKGCGIVPSARDSDKGHEVAKFSTVNHAVRSYIRNLNTHIAYKQLRSERASLRQQGENITGIALAPTLSQYSEERGKYVNKVVKFINQNKLQRFNVQFMQSLQGE